MKTPCCIPIVCFVAVCCWLLPVFFQKPPMIAKHILQIPQTNHRNPHKFKKSMVPPIEIPQNFPNHMLVSQASPRRHGTPSCFQTPPLGGACARLSWQHRGMDQPRSSQSDVNFINVYIYIYNYTIHIYIYVYHYIIIIYIYHIINIILYTLYTIYIENYNNDR